MKNFNVNHFWMCDDIFGLKPGWVQEFRNVVKAKGLKFKYIKDIMYVTMQFNYNGHSFHSAVQGSTPNTIFLFQDLPLQMNRM